MKDSMTVDATTTFVAVVLFDGTVKLLSNPAYEVSCRARIESTPPLMPEYAQYIGSPTPARHDTDIRWARLQRSS